jgi:CubicO group peptidase (beta-lactamase class C family)
MKRAIIFLLFFGSSTLFAQRKSDFDKAVYSAMDENVEILLKKSKANSVSIGIIRNGKIYTKYFGEIDEGKGNQANGDTHFEIGSVTKLFTGILMAKAVLEGKIDLEDDIRKYLNGSYPNLEYKTIPIKIKDLITFKTTFDKELPDNSKIRVSENDSTAFQLRRLDEKYDKKQFFEDLKTVKLEAVPGVVFKYSNLNLELSALILENVYHENYETLLNENIFSQLKMNVTKLNLQKNDFIANGYNRGRELMPTSFTNLWGAGGYRNSTMEDLMKFMSFELDAKNKLVQETQRNIFNSEQNWNGYFWESRLLITGNFVISREVFMERRLFLQFIQSKNWELC